MNIAFDISPLLTASGGFGDKSGVYRYMYGLLDALSKILAQKDKKSKLILFSFNADLLSVPISPDILKFLERDNIRIINNFLSLPPQNLSDNALFDIPPVKFILKLINNVVKFTDLYYKYVNDKRFKLYIKFLKKEFERLQVEIVYHSETSFYPIEGYKNIITIYDLTALKMFQFHREQTIDLQKRKLKFTEKYCDGIVCISGSTRKDLISLPEFSNKKNITIIYPGLDQTFNCPSSNSSDTISIENLNIILEHHKNKIVKKKYLLYYGTFEPRKNLIYLVKAFVDLQKCGEIPTDFKLILMGGDGWGHIKNSIRNFVKENFPIHTKNNIIILDFLNDEFISAFIKYAYAVVYPSLYEGFGLPVLESMAIGTPVICSNTSSLPEVGGNAVLYVNPSDFGDLKEKIKHLISNSELASKMSELGKKQSQQFNWQRSARKLYTFLCNL